MGKTRTLLTYHDLGVEVEDSPSMELMDHLHSTVLGQPGGFQYRHMDLEERLTAPGENYFMFLRKKGKMIGSVGFVGRHMETAGLKHDSWLIRYFSIKAPLRSDPKRRKSKEELKDEGNRSSVLGRFIQPIAASPWQIRGAKEEGGPTILYALVEQKNLRSMNFSAQIGMETVGEVANFSFSRLRPKRSKRLEVLPENEQENMLNLLQAYYNDYTLFYGGRLFNGEGYYVIREEGRIVAGVQVYPISWNVVDFGGALANRIVKALTRIPWMRMRIDPEEIRLLAFDGIFCVSGFEKSLYELLEGALERNGRYVGMLMMDMDSELYGIFRRNGRLGILHRILGTFSAEVRARFINIPDDVKKYFIDHPTYIPTYDNS